MQEFIARSPKGPVYCPDYIQKAYPLRAAIGFHAPGCAAPAAHAGLPQKKKLLQNKDSLHYMAFLPEPAQPYFVFDLSFAAALFINLFFTLLLNPEEYRSHHCQGNRSDQKQPHKIHAVSFLL